MAKRTNGEGTIWQDKKGLWHGELTISYDDSGKREKKSFSSMNLEILQKKMNDEKFKLNRNMSTQSSDFTIMTWMEFWLKTYKLNSVKSRTYDYYENALMSYVYNIIGKIKLDKIKSLNIQQLYNSLGSKGLSTSTIKGVHIALNQGFEQAIINELIYKNPCKGAKIPKKQPRKSRPLTVDEQEKFLKLCTGTTYHNFFIFLLNTGMRCGEGMAITWQDVDLSAFTVSVNKNMSRIKNRSEDAETKDIQVLESTKTPSGYRTIPLNKKCMNSILINPNGNMFVFSSKAGTPLSQRNISRAFKELLDKAGIPNDLTIHSLRHTFATRLLEKGANIKVVSELLGHKSIQITLDIYAHVLPNLKSEAINLLN